MKVVLASSSPYRKKLLEDFGLPCLAHAPLIDEEELKDPRLGPEELAVFLAKEKAKSLREKFADSIIIGGDQLAHLDGEILGKAGTAEKASEQLMKLQGKTHELITSICVIKGVSIYTHTNKTLLTMRSLTRDQAEQFVHRDQAWDCAGSYKLEKSGLALFSKIETEDHSAIIGLPLIALTDILIEANMEFPFFKNS